MVGMMGMRMLSMVMVVVDEVRRMVKKVVMVEIEDVVSEEHVSCSCRGGGSLS